LIALNATLMGAEEATRGGARDPLAPAGEELAPEMKRLAVEVRTATDRTHELAQEVEREIAAAVERMRGVRQRVAARLERIPRPPTPAEAAARPTDDLVRLLERVREMIQDATQKGERLSAAGERASRAADRLVRRLDDEVAELAGLVARLAPAGAALAPPSIRAMTFSADALRSPLEPTADAGDAPAAEPGARGPGLRLLGQEHVSPGEPPRPREGSGGPGEEPS
jgi:ABC-type transporter Mla subunit MlaD